MRTVKMTRLALLFWLFAAFWVTAQEKADPLGTLFFISCDNSGCECMMKTSKRMTGAIDILKKDLPAKMAALEIRKVDFFQTRPEARELMDRFKIEYPPALVLLDKTGKVIFMTAYDFEKKHQRKFNKAVQKLLR